MKINRLILFCFLSVLFLIGCKENKPAKNVGCSEANTIKIPTDAMTKFYFKDSSWWLYQDSITHQLDSTWVINSRTSTSNKYFFTTLNNKCYEYYGYEIINLQGKRTLVKLAPNGVNDNENEKYSNEFFRVDFSLDPAGYHSYSRFLLYGNNYRNPSIDGDTLVFSNKIEILNTTYNNVVHLITSPQTEDIYKEAWYADSVGLIKYRLLDNSVWELIRYNAKQ